MPMYSQEKSARTAFEVYSNAVGGKAYNGEPIPTWDKLPMKIRDAWVKGVSAAVDEFNRFLIESQSE